MNASKGYLIKMVAMMLFITWILTIYSCSTSYYGMNKKAVKSKVKQFRGMARM